MENSFNEELLIFEVRKRPYLYNPSHTEYVNKHVVDEAWSEISRNLGCTGMMHFSTQNYMNLYMSRNLYNREI